MTGENRSEGPELATLTIAPDLASARLVQGLLQSAGIDCFIPDENLLSQASYLSGIAGGLRVQVRESERERAQMMLDDFRMPESPSVDDEPAMDSQAVAEAQRLAARALRVAILGFILWPLPHPYALSLAITALSRKELTGPARRQAHVALLVSIGAILAFLFALFSLLSRLRR
jgi:hypothetical protein